MGSALLAKKNNYNVFISDAGDILDSTKEKLIYSSINFEENSHEKAKTLNVDLVIKSPGISDSSDIVKFLDSKQLKIISEIEFASNYCNSKIIGITGSNGKTTTTTLIHKLISDAGFLVQFLEILVIVFQVFVKKMLNLVLLNSVVFNWRELKILSLILR